MPRVIESLDQAIKILQANIEVLRNESGRLAAEGKDDISVASDQGATFLEAAVILIVKAQERI